MLLIAPHGTVVDVDGAEAVLLRRQGYKRWTEPDVEPAVAEEVETDEE